MKKPTLATATRARIALVFVCAIAAAQLPVRASDPATISCLMAFGTYEPRSWCEPGVAGVVTPISQPFGGSWEKGILFVRGMASRPGPVRIEVSDGRTSVIKITTALRQDDPEQDRLLGSFAADFKVQELGVHRVTTDDPPTTYGARASLTVTASAIDPGDGSVGPAREVTVTKFAATPRDAYSPTFSAVRWPPARWCHYPAVTGYCGETRETTVRVGPIEQRRVRQSTGQTVVRGIAADDVPSAHGRASGIADIVMTIMQGDRVFDGPRSVVTRTNAVTGQWNVVLDIEDFQPNFLPGWPPYRIVIEATDAWGNTSRLVSPEFVVYDA